MDATLFSLAEYTAPAQPVRKTYAVNLCDLTALRGEGPGMIGILLRDFVTNPPTHVDTDRSRMDGFAILRDGPAAQDPERADALIEFLQTSLGPRKLHRRIRCYQEGPRGGWREIVPHK